MTASDCARATYMRDFREGDGVGHEPDPNPRPVGVAYECWTNAAHLVRSDPERYIYVEGVVSLLGVPEMHGYAYDRIDRHVVETTPGYEAGLEYRGRLLDIRKVDQWHARHPDEYQGSVTWRLLVEMCENDRPYRWFVKRFVPLMVPKEGPETSEEVLDVPRLSIVPDPAND